MGAVKPEAKVDILLVDDHPANLLALEAILGELGQNLVKAHDGEQALALLREADFAVVLLDVQMQGLDGFETARLIRRQERSRQTPIIFLTAFEDDPNFRPEAAYALGAVDYLVKPLVPNILRAKVSGFIELFEKTRRLAIAEADVREQLRHVLATVNDMVLVLDRELRYIYVNDRMVEASGIPREAIVGRRLREVFPDAADSLLERELLRVLQENATRHFEFYHAAYDRWFDNRAYPTLDGLILVTTEITERKKNESRQRLLGEAGRILGSSLDFEATLSDVCRSFVPSFADWCSLDLLSEGGLPRRIQVAHKDPAMVELARDFRRRYPPSADDQRGVMKVLRTGEPEVVPEITDEMLVRAARDEEHLRSMRSLGLRSLLIVPLAASGRTIGALTLVMTSSARRFNDADLGVAVEIASRAALAVENARLFAEATEAIRVRDEALTLHRGIEEKLTLLVEASGSLSASLDLSSVLGAVLALSRQLISADAYAVWRYRPESGRWGIELGSGLSEEYQQSTISVVKETPSMPDNAIIAEDVRECDYLGDRIQAYEREGISSLMSIPLKVHGSVSGSLVFYYRSLHRFDEIEVRVGTALSNLAGSAIGTAELYKGLRDNDRRKDEFLAMLAHELRNPLSAISNAVRLSRQSQVAEDALEWSKDVIERQTGKLARLIDDLLDVSRITRGKIQLKKELVDARRVLDSALDAVKPLMDERKHEVTVWTDPRTLPLEADPIRLEQIFINLMTNAAKYTEAGGRISVTAEKKEGTLVFAVRDNGIGIHPDSLPTMFELFAQGERSIARSDGGLGIGLTIVRKLVEMHGGSVSGQSEGQNKGSVFTVRLPAADEHSVGKAAAPVAPARRQRCSRILIVDDNADTLRGMAKLLKLLGHEVATAHDGPSGLEAARNFRPNVVLLDIGLPGMNGYEIAPLLRREEYGDKLRIIAISGYGQEEDRRRSREAGFDHHLVKPIDHDALLTLLSGSS
jgi:PAS domain S-box-containing protein